MQFSSAHRRLTWIVVVALAVVTAVAAWLWTLPSNSDSLSIGNYGPEKQREWAQRLVDGLNTHDAEQVPVLKLNGKLSGEQRNAIESVMPKFGCIYELVSVRDLGEQTEQRIPGLPTAGSTYRFDATLDERCAGQLSGTQDIGVVAIAEMGYWEPYSFVNG